jgi:ribonuclease HII
VARSATQIPENAARDEAKLRLGANDRRLLEGADLIIGVDEVGRGSLAGPVVVCAASFATIPDDQEVRDSKQMTPRQRERVAARLRRSGVRCVMCEIWVEVVDRLNILEATRLAMRSAALSLMTSRSVVVTDFVDPGDVGCPVESPKKADQMFFCVAAASVMAKVHRDRIMVDLGLQDPRWEWGRNKGYGTLAHRRALTQHGPSALHRKSFGWSPVLP